MEQGNGQPVTLDIGEEFEHAAEKLEFRAVLELICSRAQAERSRRVIRATEMLASVQDAEYCQAEIAELRALREGGEDLPIAGWRDSGELLQAVNAPGLVAGGEELAGIAAGERTAHDVVRYLERQGERATLLGRRRDRFQVRPEIIERISKTIGPDFEVLDGASSELRRIRKRVGALRKRLRDEFADFARQQGGGQGYEFVTMRGERYVVSLPRSAATEVKGIVHQASGSGASLYIEPLEFIEKNNMLESLLEEEEQEVRRILAALTAAVFEHRDALIGNQNELLDLDVISAKASFAAKFRCVPPAHGGDRRLILKGGRHPLLEQRLVAEGREIVPLDLACGPELRVLVISGPNAGGKTVALKTVGLLTLMDRAGLLVPCREGTVMPGYNKVFVDIGDDQSIEKSLSTFSSHVMRLNRILTLADGDSLVLVDEIGDGTDPEEGAALAEAVLERLLGLCGRTIVTTHLRTLKGWAHVQGGVENATLEFDHERLEPLFRLRLGVPGRSWGIEMAGRLGLSADIIERARDTLGADVLRMEELLAHLERTEQAVGRKREELLRRERMLGELVERYRDKLDRFREHRDEMVDQARQEALDIVTSTRREMERLVKEIRTTQAERRVIRETRERLQRRQEDFERRAQRGAAVRPIDPTAVKPGAWVRIMSLEQRGKVLSVGESPRIQVELQGGVRVETNIDDLAASSPVEEAGRPKATWSAASFEPVTGELMVRGMERGEALEAVDGYIDRAVLQGLRTVVIIHGVGRGVLRRAIYEALRDDPRVEDLHPGEPEHGGDGVAVVHLK